MSSIYSKIHIESNVVANKCTIKEKNLHDKLVLPRGTIKKRCQISLTDSISSKMVEVYKVLINIQESSLFRVLRIPIVYTSLPIGSICQDLILVIDIKKKSNELTFDVQCCCFSKSE